MGWRAVFKAGGAELPSVARYIDLIRRTARGGVAFHPLLPMPKTKDSKDAHSMKQTSIV